MRRTPRFDLGRIAGALVGVIVALALVIGFLLVLRGRDDASLDAQRPAGPGQLLSEQAAAAQDPPAAGEHRTVPIARDGVRLSRDELLSALALGDVVLVYGRRADEPPLRALQRAVAGRFDPALAQAGQAVVLDRVPGTSGVVALAWRRTLHTATPDDPQLRAFADAWLGAGAAP